MWQIQPNMLSNSSTYLTGKSIFKFRMLNDFFSPSKLSFLGRKLENKHRTGRETEKKYASFNFVI